MTYFQGYYIPINKQRLKHHSSSFLPYNVKFKFKNVCNQRTSQFCSNLCAYNISYSFNTFGTILRKSKNRILSPPLVHQKQLNLLFEHPFQNKTLDQSVKILSVTEHFNFTCNWTYVLFVFKVNSIIDINLCVACFIASDNYDKERKLLFLIINQLFISLRKKIISKISNYF